MINDISDLKKLFKLCRAQGIDEFKMSGLEIKFGNLPDKNSQMASYEEENGEPTEEDLMFYSSDKGQDFLDKKVGIK